MDLRLTAGEPSAAERDAVDAVLGPPGSSWVGGDRGEDAQVARGGHAARSQRHLLLPVLHEVQGTIGWISPQALGYVCRRLTIPPAEAYGVASFYALFGARAAAAGGRARLHRHRLHVPRRRASWSRSSSARSVRPARTRRTATRSGWRARASACASGRRRRWSRAPASRRDATAPSARRASPTWWPRWPAARRPSTSRGRCAPVKGELRLLRRIGHVDPTSLDSYRSAGGYAALRRAFELGPAGVIREVTESKLLGRGGAAFPTGRKWDAVARNPVRPHYLVCNADESEPGTFKDRIVIENDPFALIEALTIAGLRDRLRARLHLPARRVPAGLGAADQCDRRRPARDGCWATT